MPNFTMNAFFKILICNNFKIWNIQIQGLPKDFQRPTLFSRTFKGLDFFSKIQGLSRTSQGPYEPWIDYQMVQVSMTLSNP